MNGVACSARDIDPTRCGIGTGLDRMPFRVATPAHLSPSRPPGPQRDPVGSLAALAPAGGPPSMRSMKMWHTLMARAGV